MLEIIRDSLSEITVVCRNTDQDGAQVTDQDKTATKRLLFALGNDTLSNDNIETIILSMIRESWTFVNRTLKSVLMEDIIWEI